MRTSGTRRVQLRTRVLAGVLLITLVALAAFDLAAVTGLRRYLLSHTDAQLQTVVSLYRPLEVPAPGRLTVAPPSAQAAQAAQRSWTWWSLPVFAAQQKTSIVGPHLRLPRSLGQYYVEFVSGREPRAFVGGNPDLRPAVGVPIAAAGRWTQTVISSNGRAQLRLLAVPEGGGTLVVTTGLATVDQTVRRLELIVTLGSLAAALLVALGVALVVRRGLRPIETMAAQADRITAGDLTDRVSPRDPRTEVGRLGTALNGMLARIEATVDEREASQELTRRFFADASHELRNPLASLRANAELYQQGALPRRPQVDEAMRRIGLEAQRMSGLVDDMLRLARLDQHPGQQHHPVDLTALICGCAERARINDSHRRWHTDIAAGLEAAGDEELLRRAVDNLLANVCAHTPGHAAAGITAAESGGSITIEVSDDGPGVPASQLPSIFDRFYRASTSAPHPGSGLGLAIVSAIASAHDGTATATANSPRGLRVTLTLPASTPRCSPRRPPPVPRSARQL